MKYTFILLVLSVSPFYATAQSTAVKCDTACATLVSEPSLSADNNNLAAASLFPNPATNELNVIYNANADVKNIAVYNIIGKIISIYKVTSNNSASLNLENIPPGIYFVRLLNSNGDPVVTRKFTKQ